MVAALRDELKLDAALSLEETIDAAHKQLGIVDAPDGAGLRRKAELAYRIVHGIVAKGTASESPRDQALPEHERKWVHPAGQPVLPHVRISTHDRTNGYQSCQIEREWLDGERKGKICETQNAPGMKEASEQWLSYSTRAWLPGGKPAPEPTPEEHKSLSHFRVGDVKEPIEPLTGIARHPFASTGCGGDVDIFDIRYLIPHNNCGAATKPRVLLFDMGASVGFQGVPGGVYAQMPSNGGGLAPSLPLFYRIYADRCLEPDEIYAWEPNMGVSGPDWWGELPGAIRSKVHFYNDFVNEGEIEQAEGPKGTHPANSFLEILEDVAKASKEDFVVVKVDIDTSQIELTIVEAIAERPEIAGLIDELYFEYHFYYDGHNFGWGDADAVKGDVDTAMGLMHRLRALGVRSHFWI